MNKEQEEEEEDSLGGTEEHPQLNTQLNGESQEEEEHVAGAASHLANATPMEEEEEEETTVIESETLRLVDEAQIHAGDSELKLQEVVATQQPPQDSEVSVENTSTAPVSFQPDQQAAGSDQDAAASTREAHSGEMNDSPPKAFQPPANPPPPPDPLHSSSGKDTR